MGVRMSQCRDAAIPRSSDPGAAMRLCATGFLNAATFNLLFSENENDRSLSQETRKEM
jgi:hypothetical protein